MWAAAYPQPLIGRCCPAQPTSVIGFARFANVGPAGETAICKTDHRCRHRIGVAPDEGVSLEDMVVATCRDLPLCRPWGDDNTCLCRCAGYDSGAGISAQPRNVFNPPPVCRWVQPAGQGLVLLVGIKQHANGKVNSMLFCCGVNCFGTMGMRRMKMAQSGGRTRIFPSFL